MEVLEARVLPILMEDDIVTVRRTVRELAVAQGFDPFAAAALTTATSELARNTWVHGGGGRVIIERVRSGNREGLHLRFEDEGQGFDDLERALRGGFSTVGSLGLGLSGSVRLVDSLTVDTSPGEGARIDIIKWRRTF